MHLIEIVRQPSEIVRDELLAFADRVAAEGGSALSDHLRLDLRQGGSHGFVAVRADDAPGSTVGFAQISAGNDSSSLEVVTAADADIGLVHDLADTAVDVFRRDGGGTLHWWLDDPDERLLDIAGSLGLSPVRELHEMRRSLPLDAGATIETRPFVPGADDDAWLAVNNRAFADHGEQGGWTRETLESRQREPWFDPDGFRLHEIGDRLAGFCWTKLHHDHDRVIGEIYAIAVDPDFHGRGLGREMTLAGLDSIAGRGVMLANLYVDAANVAAVSLYDRLGFAIHRTRVACGGDLSARPSMG